MKCILALQSMYKSEGITTFITDEPLDNLKKEQSYQCQQSLMEIGMHNQASQFSLKFNQQTSLYNKLIQTQSLESLNQFLENFKSNIGNQIGSSNPQQDVIIVNLCFTQVPQIYIQFNSDQFTNKQIKQKIDFSDIGVTFSEQNLLEFAKLSPDMFNPKYNQDWSNIKGKSSEPRGQLKFYNQRYPVDHIYHFPIGYKGYALNLQDKYGNDMRWLSPNADPETWIVLYHGTNQNCIQGITSNNLQPGIRNRYGGSKCRIIGKTIKSEEKANVYLTDDIKVAEEYAIKTQIFNGETFKIVFQCRVNPKEVRSPVSKINYYTVEDNTNIRPYRILIKKC